MGRQLGVFKRRSCPPRLAAGLGQWSQWVQVGRKSWGHEKARRPPKQPPASASRSGPAAAEVPPGHGRLPPRQGPSRTPRVGGIPGPGGHRPAQRMGDHRGCPRLCTEREPARQARHPSSQPASGGGRAIQRGAGQERMSNTQGNWARGTRVHCCPVRGRLRGGGGPGHGPEGGRGGGCGMIQAEERALLPPRHRVCAERHRRAACRTVAGVYGTPLACAMHTNATDRRAKTEVFPLGECQSRPWRSKTPTTACTVGRTYLGPLAEESGPTPLRGILCECPGAYKRGEEVDPRCTTTETTERRDGTKRQKNKTVRVCVCGRVAGSAAPCKPQRPLPCHMCVCGS